MKNKFYITTTIPYVNAELHIGHVLEFLQADALARYHRVKGDNVFFLTGTDEHGIKMERTAKELGTTAKKLSDKNSKLAKEMKDTVNLSWDLFIRTTDKKNHFPGVEKVWKELEKKGDIYKKKYSGLYCIGCEAFVSDRDLDDEGKCKIHGKEPEVLEEENYFFRMSAYSKTLKQKIQSGQMKIVPDWRGKEILSLIEKGLDDVSFSRPSNKLKWGIPVPGDESQTIYVWADALTNYISAIGYGRDEKEFSKWWPADVQVLGKDVLRFHAAIWPSMLMSLNLPLPKTLFVHGFIAVEGQKMSKSLGNIISPKELTNEYGIDAVRYYFLREISSFDDGDFSKQRFIERYNGDLANGLGNFYSRTLSLANNFGVINNNSSSIELEVENQIRKTNEGLDKYMSEFRFNDALATIWELIAFGDSYVNEKKPWLEDKTNTEKEKTILNLLFILNAVAVFIKPFLPETSEKISNSIDFENKEMKIDFKEQLFPRI